jgi:hypothetical protein
MNKLLLTSTSILAVAFASQAFAGSSSTFLLQTGNGQQATITQSGNNNSVGTSTDKPFLQQNGDTPSALAGSGGNIITINQTGNGNHVIGFDGYIHPAPALGVAGQSGTGNVATIQQDGSNGDVQLQQNGQYNGTTSGYVGSINQASSTNGNHAIVQEAGDHNDFAISQSGSSGTQNHNYATLIQGSYVTPGSYNLARINQAGGPNTGHILSSSQDGHLNNLDSTQTGTGNGNSLTSSQTNLTAVWSPNSITNLQIGSGETANLTQNGYSLTITNNQSGTGDSFVVASQNNSNNSIVNIQSGTSNTATVTNQGGTYGTINNTQSGANGSATYSQTGYHNTATLQNQYGAYSSVDVTQTGSNSTGQLLQWGNGTAASKNSIVLTQSAGDSNRAYLVQGGYFTGTGAGTQLGISAPVSGNTINVTQESLGAMSGNNYAAVQQTSNGNTSSFSQSGSNNSAIVKQ